MVSNDEASSIIGNLPTMISATLQLLFDLETAVGMYHANLREIAYNCCRGMGVPSSIAAIVRVAGYTRE